MAVPFSRNGASLPALTEDVGNLSQTVGVRDHFLCFYSLSLREARKEGRAIRDLPRREKSLYPPRPRSHPPLRPKESLLPKTSAIGLCDLGASEYSTSFPTDRMLAYSLSLCGDFRAGYTTLIRNWTWTALRPYLVL